jgi:tetratricopeptide (TPR) repeat protein
VLRLTGDYAGAQAYQRQARDLFRSLGDRLGQAWALDELGLALLMTGDHAAAAACIHESIQIHRDLGARHGMSVALNSLGELSFAASATADARAHHGEALAIARGLGSPLQQARALEGIGRTFLSDDPARAATYLRQALAIYQRIGAPGARQIQDTLEEHGLLVAPSS